MPKELTRGKGLFSTLVEQHAGDTAMQPTVVGVFLNFSDTSFVYGYLLEVNSCRFDNNIAYFFLVSKISDEKNTRNHRGTSWTRW